MNNIDQEKINKSISNIDKKITEETKEFRKRIKELENKKNKLRKKLNYEDHSMGDWAENEIKIACKKENPNWDENSFDYGCSCYASALNAYKSLCYDGHSVYTFGVTTNILNRLCKHLPLTPITDEDFVDGESYEDLTYLKKRGLKSNIQCKRMYSLFKKETLDGEVSYHDTDRSFCIDIDNPNDIFRFGQAEKIIDELYPITMPYYPKPNEQYIVFVKFGLHDKSLGEFDMYNIQKIITPEKEEININKYYMSKVVGWYSYEGVEKAYPKEGKFVPITKEIWDEAYNNQVESKYDPSTDDLEIIKHLEPMECIC